MIFQANNRVGLWYICHHHRLLENRIVFTNGCFDILHAGHVRCLSRAAEYGDILIVGVNGDESVRRLKGEGRPIQSAEDRAYILSELLPVSHVVIFNEDTPERLIRLVRPNVLVKGEDWRGKQIAGADQVETVKFVPYLPGKSTTGIIERMRGGV